MEMSKKSRRGCSVCRERKIKCDQEHPRCGGCTRLGRECSWAQLYKFRDETQRVKKYYVVSDQNQREDNDGLYMQCSTDKPLEIVWDAELSTSPPIRFLESSQLHREYGVAQCPDPARSCGASQIKRESSVVTARTAVPRHICSPALNRKQILLTAISHYSPEETVGSKDFSCGYWPSTDFLVSRHDTLFSAQAPALVAALESWGLGQIGIMHRDEEVLAESTRRYTIASTALRQSLVVMKKADFSDILTTMLVLQVTEVRMDMLVCVRTSH